jgi:hypothetical protein
MARVCLRTRLSFNTRRLLTTIIVSVRRVLLLTTEGSYNQCESGMVTDTTNKATTNKSISIRKEDKHQHHRTQSTKNRRTTTHMVITRRGTT